MSTWFPQTDRTFLERIMIHILRKGEIPTHIGFIMDGNRRYAQKAHVEKLTGHSRGFEKLTETLSWCRDLGITQATMYAFSIENFKRPREEVDGLMDLFRQQFAKLIAEFPKFDSYQICVRVYGRLDLLPLDIQQSIAKVVLRTAKNKRFYLNFAFAYTSREEISNAMTDLSDCVLDGRLQATDLNDAALTRTMYSLGMRDPDILLRTSGEIRLSDFLLWQTGFSYIFFVKELWPDFSIWSLFRGILHYQVQSPSIARSRQAYEADLERADTEYCKEVMSQTKSTLSLAEFTSQRSQRIDQAIVALTKKRFNAMEDILKNSGETTVSLDDQLNNNPSVEERTTKYQNGGTLFPTF